MFMHKIVLIFDTNGWLDQREELFFDTKRDAQRWLNFYRRNDHFVDNTGRPTPIKHSYMLKFQR